jgi:hypothetical protein
MPAANPRADLNAGAVYPPGNVGPRRHHRPTGGNIKGPELLNKYVERMYSEIEENRFLQVSYANGDKNIVGFRGGEPATRRPQVRRGP